jgi:hypothetical protein
MGVVFDSGEQSLLALLAVNGTLTAHLYTNDRTPTNTDTLMQYTEASFPGYQAEGLYQATTPATNAAGKATSSFGQITWTLSATQGSPVNVYGWYVTNQAGVLIGAERFAGAPLTVQNTGDNIKVTITMTLSSDPPNP